jgi:hypothetical protein
VRPANDTIRTMETNIWFYTFSTIAQVMAGLIGLFAVFVVYKMQDFGDVMESIRKKFVSAISHASNNTDEYESIAYEDALTMDDRTLLKHMNMLLAIFTDPAKPEKLTVDNLTRENRDLFQALLETKRNILTKLAVTLLLSLIAIGVSVFALIGTEYFMSHGYEIPFQVGFFVYFLFCLFYMGMNMYKIATK